MDLGAWLFSQTELYPCHKLLGYSPGSGKMSEPQRSYYSLHNKIESTDLLNCRKQLKMKNCLEFGLIQFVISSLLSINEIELGYLIAL